MELAAKSYYVITYNTTSMEGTEGKSLVKPNIYLNGEPPPFKRSPSSILNSASQINTKF